MDETKVINAQITMAFYRNDMIDHLKWTHEYGHEQQKNQNVLAYQSAEQYLTRHASAALPSETLTHESDYDDVN